VLHHTIFTQQVNRSFQTGDHLFHQGEIRPAVYLIVFSIRRPAIYFV
jgi:hypothetical protein